MTLLQDKLSMPCQLLLTNGKTLPSSFLYHIAKYKKWRGNISHNLISNYRMNIFPNIFGKNVILFISKILVSAYCDRINQIFLLFLNVWNEKHRKCFAWYSEISYKSIYTTIYFQKWSLHYRSLIKYIRSQCSHKSNLLNYLFRKVYVP